MAVLCSRGVNCNRHTRQMLPLPPRPSNGKIEMRQARGTKRHCRIILVCDTTICVRCVCARSGASSWRQQPRLRKCQPKNEKLFMAICRELSHWFGARIVPRCSPTSFVWTACFHATAAAAAAKEKDMQNLCVCECFGAAGWNPRHLMCGAMCSPRGHWRARTSFISALEKRGKKTQKLRDKQ